MPVVAVALVAAAAPALGASPAAGPVRLAAGPSAFPPDVLRAVVAATGCRVQMVPPLARGELPRPGVDLVEMRGEDAGALIAAGRLTVIDERAVNGLGDVPGRLRDPVRDVGGALRAIPYLWSPQLFLARSKAFGDQPPTSLRALFSRRQAVRTALPDSPLELAVAARYLGIGDPFALARDELTSAGEVVAPRVACSTSTVTPRSCARSSGGARSTLRWAIPRRSAISAPGSWRSSRVRARSPPSACSASWRARRVVGARGASPARCSRPLLRPRSRSRAG